ncbi:MAG: M48 family metalloprotease [Cyanophyceae cyanobacterium]
MSIRPSRLASPHGLEHHIGSDRSLKGPEGDRLGMQFMVAADYSPQGLVELMEILASALSGGQPPEFLSTHSYPDNRIAELEALIAESFPTGIPPELEEAGSFAQVVQPRLP